MATRRRRAVSARGLLVPNGRPTPWRKVVEHSLRGDLETGDASLPSGVERTIPAYKRSRATAGSGSMPSIDKIQTHCGTFTKAMAEVRRRRRA
ncbi:MAG TPA: hypothetical protein VFX13_13065 [Gaiellales bacterium]|jgi:hypothetical protein|nr:hypothetical protein [Gaiellales bacterium]